MLSKGKFGSVLTVTVTVAKEVRPRKFVKLSVILYDALARFCVKMLTGVEI